MVTIEKQNLRLVDVLDQAHQTSKEIKLSKAYAEVKINKQLGRNVKGKSFLSAD